MPREQWPLEVYELQKMIDEGLDVKEMTVRDLLLIMIMELKKINLHLSVLDGEEIKDHDIGG